MPRFTRYVITWADEIPDVPDQGSIASLATAAQASSGELLALGPVHDASERDARPVPPWMAVAGFADDAGARAWFTAAGDRLAATTILAPALTEPVWWPEDRAGQRPQWSLTPEPPAERLGTFVVVWATITDPEQFFDYSAHYKWTVEHAGGACLCGRPGAVLLSGAAAPDALAMMAWPADQVARRQWYDGDIYRPYKLQRHSSSRTTNVSVLALAGQRP
jgi:uncharacterized protein (DUF1330 family)